MPAGCWRERCILAAMRKLWNFIKYVLAIIFVLIAGTFAYLYYEDPIVTRRLVQAPFGDMPGPRERVPGGEPFDIPAVESRSISAPTLQQAVDYGEETGSHALIVYRDDGIELEKYYPGFDANYRSQTASMHKSVLAILVGIAIDQGHIKSVDDSAATYLPEWSNDGRSKITLRHMLRQTSGIDFATVGLNPLGGFYQLMLGADVTGASLNLPLEVEPGTQFDYNSAIPQNMGLIVQRATGKRYAQFLSEALWQHIGAGDAYVVLDSDENSMARTFCCLEATARAWLHLGLLHLDQGRLGGRQVVPADWMAAITRPGEHNPNYGYFTWLGNEHAQFRRYYNRKTGMSAYSIPNRIVADPTSFTSTVSAGSASTSSRRTELVIVRTGCGVAPQLGRRVFAEPDRSRPDQERADRGRIAGRLTDLPSRRERGCAAVRSAAGILLASVTGHGSFLACTTSS